MSRAYRSILIFSIVLQLSLFFVVVVVALWLDQIYNGDIGKLTTKSEVFRGIDMYAVYPVYDHASLTPVTAQS